jgi:hypothetical protein
LIVIFSVLLLLVSSFVNFVILLRTNHFFADCMDNDIFDKIKQPCFQLREFFRSNHRFEDLISPNIKSFLVLREWSTMRFLSSSLLEFLLSSQNMYQASYLSFAQASTLSFAQTSTLLCA